jgi:hypothetical protein
LELKFSDGKLTEFEFEVKDFSNYLLSEFYFTLEKQIQLQAPIIHPSAQDFLDNYCKYMFDEQFPEYYFAECSGELNVLFEDYTLLYTSENLKLVQKICESYPESVLCDFSKIEFKDLDGALLQPVEDQEDASACLEEYEECIADLELYQPGSDDYIELEIFCNLNLLNCMTGGTAECLNDASMCGEGESCLNGEFVEHEGSCCTGDCVNPEEDCASWEGTFFCPGGTAPPWWCSPKYPAPGGGFYGSCCLDTPANRVGCNPKIPSQFPNSPKYPGMPSEYSWFLNCDSDPVYNPFGNPFNYDFSPPFENNFPSEDEVSLGPRGGPGPGNKPPAGNPIWAPKDPSFVEGCVWIQVCFPY